jgi:hypothetical protein
VISPLIVLFAQSNGHRSVFFLFFFVALGASRGDKYLLFFCCEIEQPGSLSNQRQAGGNRAVNELSIDDEEPNMLTRFDRSKSGSFVVRDGQ